MTKLDQLRVVKSRTKLLMHVLETSKNVSMTCRRYGISRPTFYKWRKRYEEFGEVGLCNRSRKPHLSPNSTPKEVVSKIIYLRQNYHFGAGKIADYLRRYHETHITPSTVHRVLARHDMARLPTSKRYQRHNIRWKRYEKQQPGHRVQIDVKFLERIPGRKKRLYQFTAIDDCTRIRILKIYDRCNQTTAVEFADEVNRHLPFRIEVIQTDNGAEFQSRFHWHLQDKGIEHVHIRPRTPRLNGKVERSHRIDGQEFYQLLDKNGVSDDIHLFNKKLREWEDYYNYHRPHGGLSGQTPYERLNQKLKAANV